ncbi:cobalamin biosynthesis protein CobW [Mogibacterium diversum]|uniref:Cobalamin biosynthesis protein CobW n=1 Tax=Mogibacterium diversum TaxID=114527 RepID=A0A2S0L227_9FIRM|nr:GTP-binding protein [Mogibacterium diversum]AVM47351.1 cobalamin biosynthesis protein CobW [Mogibacterium diversum]
MTKVDIFSGFLGAGKTTLIRKLIEEAYGTDKIVLIENEFGEIGVDKGFLQNTGIEINQMNAGCICCTLVGDFGKALNEVIEKYNPERILIEPSGVGKLSDVIIAVQDLKNDKIELNGFTTVVDATKADMYMSNFGEFYENQVEHASSIILSHTAGMSQDDIDKCIALLREHNKEASIVTTDWKEIDGSKILEIMEQKKTLSAELDRLREEAYREQAEHEAEHHHHDHEHHHHDDEEHECCGHGHHHDHDHEHHHHDDDDEHECCGHGHHHDHDHEHHHHDDEEHECCGHGHHHDHDHEHHHHDDEEHGCCGHGHHHHHHHGHGHHADEVFDEMGVETAHRFSRGQLEQALAGLMDSEQCGQVLRAKGFVAGTEGEWYEFDYIPGEPEVRTAGEAETTGVICVIGVGLKKDKIKELFGI